MTKTKQKVHNDEDIIEKQEEVVDEATTNNENDLNNSENEELEKVKPSKEQEYLLLAQKTQAEFENYKKRIQKESINKYAEITSDVVTSILPVMDNLEKAVEAKTEDTSYQEGVKLILKQFMDVLNKFGVEEIEAVGKSFDPEFHEAVSHVEDPEKGEQEVVQEYRKGYKIGTKVVRHSMVIVAN